ncbi:MAG TPA: hypothetical protein VJ909_08455, partial [Prolixibacteraceae bacterium]|nr:hypothetical protein [Prolixibacteraceae bacterium]
SKKGNLFFGVAARRTFNHSQHNPATLFISTTSPPRSQRRSPGYPLYLLLRKLHKRMPLLSLPQGRWLLIQQYLFYSAIIFSLVNSIDR